jgi:hypothetical protein
MVVVSGSIPIVPMRDFGFGFGTWESQSSRLLRPNEWFVTLSDATAARPPTISMIAEASMKTQTWFVTGASSGFGRAFVEHAISQGHNVVATARDASPLQQLIAQAPDRVLAHRLDVRHPDQAVAAVKSALERFAAVDVLINNAGYGIVGAFEETPDDELRALMDTNFFGAMNVMRAMLPASALGRRERS